MCPILWSSAYCLLLTAYALPCRSLAQLAVDGDVAADLAELLSCWGTPHEGGPICECLDTDADGDIDAADLAELLSRWGGDDNGDGIPDECE